MWPLQILNFKEPSAFVRPLAFDFNCPRALGARANIFMQCAICVNYLLSLKDTKNIRDHAGITHLKGVYLLLIPVLVKIPFMKWNSQVTNNRTFSSYLVGTSETTRTSIDVVDPDDLKFNQWLAGLIDGDGSLLISKKGYPSCEITVGLEDEPMLRYIQNKLSGSIKIRSGVKALRYRLHNKSGMINLLNRINGLIRNTARIKQLHHLCSVLNISFISPDELHNKHYWFTGFFDAEGTVTYSLKGMEPKKRPQLTISVTNKLLVDVIHYQKIFGGYIYYDRSQNGYYKWTIQKRDSIMEFLEYFKFCPSRSIKSHRLHLIKEYYRLIDLSAFEAEPDSSPALYKAWFNFNEKWSAKLKI